MNKRAKIAIFLGAATVGNILVMLLIFFSLLTVFEKFVAIHIYSETITTLIMLLIFVLSLGGAFLIYTLTLRKLDPKLNLEAIIGKFMPRSSKRKQ